MSNLLFTTPFCAKCPGIKKLLKDKGVDFKEVNAIQSRDLVEKFLVRGVPSLVIREQTENGETYRALTSFEIEEKYK